MIFVTDYYASNEVGRVCKMGGQIEAETRAEADEIAERTGHTIIGVLVDEVDADGLGDFCDAVQKQRDEDWLRGQGE